MRRRARRAGLALVVELLAHPLADLLRDLARVDRRVHAAVEREGEFELLQVGFDGRLHVRILQLAGEQGAVLGGRAMHLPERGGGGRFQVEPPEPRLPVGAEFGLHPPLDEGRAHRRGVALQFLKFGCVFGRDHVRDRGEQLRHLHDRALQPAQRLGHGGRIAGALSLAPEQPRAGHPGRDAPDIRADPGVTGRARGQAVRFGIDIGHRASFGRA
jgi:hypothetical protein